MANPFGYTIPAIALGLGAILIKNRRRFVYLGQDIVPQIVVEEMHQDVLTITQHPVEQGAAIADHAYKEPAEVTIKCAWSNSPAGPSGLVGYAVAAASTLGGPAVGAVVSAGQTIQAAQSLLSGNAPSQARAIYEQLLQIQASRIPFDIYTGKRSYKNMLFASLLCHTDPETENVLALVARCQQVIIVQTRVVNVPINTNPEEQKTPEETAPVQDMGPQSLQPGTNYVPSAATLPPATSESLSAVNISITETIDQLPGLADKVSSGLSSTLENIKATVTATLDPLVQQLPGQLQTLNGQLASAASSIQGGLPTVIQGVQQAIPTALNELQATINNAIAQIPKAFEIPFQK